MCEFMMFMANEGIMSKKNSIACVTGASSVVGKRIVNKLLADDWHVRILTRGNSHIDAKIDKRVEVIKGDLCDAELLRSFVRDTVALFHCAGELYDTATMWGVNVDGTKHVLDAISKANVRYFCYISSASVVGNVKVKNIDENTGCRPYILYEKSKLAAEQMIMRGVEGCRVVILRPTNIVDEERVNYITRFVDGSWRDKIQLFVKGGECAHIVHADDVAAAAMYLMSHATEKPQCYIVSCDDDKMNTYSGIWMLSKALRNAWCKTSSGKPLYLPTGMTQVLRRLLRGNLISGDVRFSSAKLLSTGFKYECGFRGAIRRLVKRK